jgi:hypothetical protein
LLGNLLERKTHWFIKMTLPRGWPYKSRTLSRPRCKPTSMLTFRIANKAPSI